MTLHPKFKPAYAVHGKFFAIISLIAKSFTLALNSNRAAVVWVWCIRCWSLWERSPWRVGICRKEWAHSIAYRPPGEWAHYSHYPPKNSESAVLSAPRYFLTLFQNKSYSKTTTFFGHICQTNEIGDRVRRPKHPHPPKRNRVSALRKCPTKHLV